MWRDYDPEVRTVHLAWDGTVALPRKGLLAAYPASERWARACEGANYEKHGSKCIFSFSYS